MVPGAVDGNHCYLSSNCRSELEKVIWKFYPRFDTNDLYLMCTEKSRHTGNYYPVNQLLIGLLLVYSPYIGIPSKYEIKISENVKEFWYISSYSSKTITYSL